jgi:hypothetical protein
MWKKPGLAAQLSELGHNLIALVRRDLMAMESGAQGSIYLQRVVDRLECRLDVLLAHPRRFRSAH